MQLWDVIIRNKNVSNKEANYNFVSANFVRLNIYLRNDEILFREQQATYPLSKLFSDIGGTLGLWVGLSLLTFVELIQLGVRVILLICGNKTE